MESAVPVGGGVTNDEGVSVKAIENWKKLRKRRGGRKQSGSGGSGSGQNSPRDEPELQEKGDLLSLSEPRRKSTSASEGSQEGEKAPAGGRARAGAFAVTVTEAVGAAAAKKAAMPTAPPAQQALASETGPGGAPPVKSGESAATLPVVPPKPLSLKLHAQSLERDMIASRATIAALRAEVDSLRAAGSRNSSGSDSTGSSAQGDSVLNAESSAEMTSVSAANERRIRILEEQLRVEKTQRASLEELLRVSETSSEASKRTVTEEKLRAKALDAKVVCARANGRSLEHRLEAEIQARAAVEEKASQMETQLRDNAAALEMAQTELSTLKVQLQDMAKQLGPRTSAPAPLSPDARSSSGSALEDDERERTPGHYPSKEGERPFDRARRMLMENMLTNAKTRERSASDQLTFAQRSVVKLREERGHLHEALVQIHTENTGLLTSLVAVCNTASPDAPEGSIEAGLRAIKERLEGMVRTSSTRMKKVERSASVALLVPRVAAGDQAVPQVAAVVPAADGKAGVALGSVVAGPGDTGPIEGPSEAAGTEVVGNGPSPTVGAGVGDDGQELSPRGAGPDHHHHHDDNETEVLVEEHCGGVRAVGSSGSIGLDSAGHIGYLQAVNEELVGQLKFFVTQLSVLPKGPQWVKDDDALRCFKCDAEFGLFLRRHHCRCCGMVYCDDHSSGRAVLPWLGYKDPVRLCDLCSDKHAVVRGDKTNGAPVAGSSSPPTVMDSAGAA